MFVHFSPLPPQNVIFVKVCIRSQASLEYRSACKTATFHAGDLGSSPGSQRSPGEENYPFQYSGLETSMLSIGYGCHFRLPMRIADQSVYLTLQFSSVAQSCPTLCNPMNYSTPGLPVHHQPRSSLKLTSIESVMPSSHLILCRPLVLLPPIPPSIRVFSSESTLCMRWPRYGGFSFSISPSNEYSGLISFRMDWSDLLAVQGTLKSLLQHHNSKASLFFGAQLSSQSNSHIHT